MTKTDAAAVEIIQADRDAAADAYDAIAGCTVPLNFGKRVRAGEESELTQAFARHRQSSISAATETLEKIAEDLIDQQDEPWLKDDGASHDRVHFWRDKAIVASRDIRAAIAAMKAKP